MNIGRKRYNKLRRSNRFWKGFGIFALAILAIGGGLYGANKAGWLDFMPFAVGEDDGGNALTDAANNNDDVPNSDIVTREVGQAATLYLDAYTGSWGEAGSETEVYPAYTVMKDGVAIVNDANANSSDKVVVADTVDIFGTGASYYVEPQLGVKVTSERTQAPEIKARTILATTNLVWTCYDETGNTALTADDHANNTADYAGGNIGAGEKYTYFCKLKNNVADKSFRLCRILTYHCGGEADDFTLVQSGWESTSFPDKGVLFDSFLLGDDTSVNTSCTFKHVYKPTGSDYIELNEWDNTGLMEFLFDSDDTTQPTANGDTYIGAVALDCAYEKNKDGDVVFDYYKHDDNSDPGSVGLDEAPEATGYRGLDTGFAIEPQ